jgi:hypothetical protein
MRSAHSATRPNAEADSTKDSTRPASGDDRRGLGILPYVSAERDELKRLVEDLPDERVPAVLAEVRRQSRPHPIAAWPPAWFGSFASGRTDLGSNHEDLLAEGFGRS